MQPFSITLLRLLATSGVISFEYLQSAIQNHALKFPVQNTTIEVLQGPNASLLVRIC